MPGTYPFLSFGRLMFNQRSQSLNHVRLPIGYWAWDVSHGEPYHQGQLYYLEQYVQFEC